jgi:hypothetical protein
MQATFSCSTGGVAPAQCYAPMKPSYAAARKRQSERATHGSLPPYGDQAKAHHGLAPDRGPTAPPPADAAGNIQQWRESASMEWTCERAAFGPPPGSAEAAFAAALGSAGTAPAAPPRAPPQPAATPPQAPQPSQRLLVALGDALAAMRDESTHYATPHERDMIAELAAVCAATVRRADVVDATRAVTATFGELVASLTTLVLEPCDDERVRLLDATADAVEAIRKELVRLKSTNALSRGGPDHDDDDDD